MLLRSLRRGNSVIEFALTLPVIMAILSGLVDFGWYINQSVLLSDAIRDAVRMGATTNPGTSAVSVAESRITAACTANGVRGTPNVTTTLIGASPDEKIGMNVAVPFTPLFGLTPGIPANLHASLVMRLEYQP